jgi:hypothetical protein
MVGKDWFNENQVSEDIMKTLAKAFRALPIHCTLIALPCLVPLGAAAAQSGDFTYTTNNGAITITKYTGPGGAVTIPDKINSLPVTTIGAGAFSGCTSLTSVVIPGSVTVIGLWAFSTCTNLTNATIASGVKVISDSAFSSCRSLTSIAIPNSVTGMGDDVFYGCTKLTSVGIPGSMPNVWPGMFYACVKLTNVTIGDGVRIIEDRAFGFCINLTSVIIPGSVTQIWYSAFQLCTNLTSICFKGDAPSLGCCVFYAIPATIYHLLGTTGWGPTFNDRPTAPWPLPHPTTLSFGPSFGLHSNRFGFRISWATNASVVVDASTSLATPTWSPIATNTITMGIDPLTDGWTHFSDPDWTNQPTRFYRVRSP